jgi:hypothetical protein
VGVYGKLRVMMAASALLLAAACSGPGAPPQPGGEGGGSVAPLPPGLASQAAVACALPEGQLERIRSGYDPDRSGDIVVVPKEPSYLEGGGLPHSGPWDYLQRVPLFLYGPGYVRPVGKISTPVTLADLAPTLAELLGFSFHAADGQPMTEALLPRAARTVPPRLIVVVVWDAGGRDVLSAWPKDWPHFLGLISRGAWMENATVGESPSVTAPVHATIGTGAYSRTTGIPDNDVRLNGRIVNPWLYGPAILETPTLADLYDPANGNRPLIGAIGATAWHLGMIGHGSERPGGDRDVALIRGGDEPRWTVPDVDLSFYRTPGYANRVPGFGADERMADLLDGNLDGAWRGYSIQSLDRGFDTPARLPYETRVVDAVIAREGFGADPLPDLLYVNYKLIDHVGHVFDLNSLEMRDTLRVQDQQLPPLIQTLDRRVGHGKWVLVVTADHGATPDHLDSHAFPISHAELVSDLERTFDDADRRQVFELVKGTQIFVNRAELHQNGYTLADVSGFLLRYTKGMSLEDPTLIPAGKRNDRVFSAAFPASMLRRLPC